jgi:formylglycine-generating enzyme required for sulfatase activity
MAGNTWDWCSSLPDPYPYDPTDGREDPAALGPRVLRGGAMGLKRWVARCAFRNSTHPDDYGFSIGFRMVLDARPDDAQDAG